MRSTERKKIRGQELTFKKNLTYAECSRNSAYVFLFVSVLTTTLREALITLVNEGNWTWEVKALAQDIGYRKGCRWMQIQDPLTPGVLCSFLHQTACVTLKWCHRPCFAKVSRLHQFGLIERPRKLSSSLSSTYNEVESGEG